MNIDLYLAFSKRKNSTLTPTSTPITYPCILKDPVSFHNPSVIVHGLLSTQYNYAYIGVSTTEFATFGWYYVTDITQISRDEWQIDMVEDELASHKGSIGASKAYIAYSSTYTDRFLPDTRIAVSAMKNVDVEIASTFLDGDGSYIITTFSDDNTGNPVGLGHSYWINQANLKKVKNWLTNNSVLSDIAVYMGGETMSAIFSLVWIPIAFDITDTSVGTAVQDMMIGAHSYSGDTMGAQVDSIRLDGFARKHGSVDLSLASLPDDFRRAEPYSSANLYLPGIGCIDINLADFINVSKITVDYDFEMITGNIFYVIKNADGRIIQTASACLAAQCPLGQMTVNTAGVASSLAGVVGGAAALAFGAPAVAAVGLSSLLLSGANAVLQANRRAASISGAVGGRIGSVIKDIRLTLFIMNTEDPADADYIATRGRPVGKVMQISSLSGFVQCENAQVNADCYGNEYDAINAALNTGFYYE